jgi:hypothetical protein
VRSRWLRQDHPAGRLGHQHQPGGGLAVAGPDDNDPARFWRYVVAALDRVRGGLAEDLLARWEQAAGWFWRVAPRSEVAAIEEAHEGTA